ncbi:hypothetical protein N7G274_009699 [Stereocaulon virgatum]|uniref:Uncharacterized protein n=1 Tax=Stereocaulon virgatum TaxID=373712 RepID=A0ABR3ZX94_9LECA
MATANAWLQKQRKSDLADMADHVGLKNYEKFKKSDLEMVLEEHLRANQSSLAKDPRVSPFYQGVDPASPVKHNPGVAESKPKRRQTIKRDEVDAAENSLSTALATRTPSRALAIARSVPLPPSPAVLANQIDARTTSMRNSISEYVSTSPLPGTMENIRSSLSTVTSIQLLTLFIEAWGLRSQVLPLRYLSTLPAVPAIGLGEIAIKIPDLFALLTMAFWGPVGLWFATSIGLPLLGSWFINLKGDAGYDTVSFNVVKALAAWIVYVRGGVGGESTRVVERGVLGGSGGMLIGAFIGLLAGIYDAVLKR